MAKSPSLDNSPNALGSPGNLEPNMSGMGAALMNPSPNMSGTLNSNLGKASHVGNNLSELKRDYIKSRANLAEAEAKLYGRERTYIKQKEDYLVASIKFLVLQKKYIESGGNASNANFAAFTDPGQLGALNDYPFINSPNSSNSSNSSEYPIAGFLNRPPTPNTPGPKPRSSNTSNWFAGTRNFLSRKVANYKAARNTRKLQAAAQAELAKRDKAERDKRAAQVADATRRQARQLADNAVAEKAARDARSSEEKAARDARTVLAREAKAASEKASRNAVRATAKASRPPKRSFDYQKSPTVWTLGQLLMS
jgi:hypothetical protein